MTILVTGATGFIGNYVVRELLANGCSVVGSSAHPERARAFEWFDQVRYVPFDLARFDRAMDLYGYFGRPDALIHLAWEGLPYYKEYFHLAENLPRHIGFLNNLLDGGLRDLTVTGTCLEYGMREGALKETMPAAPGNPYAEAKDRLRAHLEMLAAVGSTTFRWVRLFYMFGAGQNPKSLLSQLDKALEDGAAVFNMSGGEQWRDYLPVETAARYIVRIALQKAVTGVVNCCSGAPVSVKELVQRHLEARGRQIELNFGYYPYPDYEPMRFWGDNTKLKTIT